MWETTTTTAIIFYTALLLVLLFSGLWVAFAMGLLGVVTVALWLGVDQLRIIGVLTWNTMNQFILVALPLFVFMGFMMETGGVAREGYKAVAPLMGRIPGGLYHTNIAVGAVFAACCGSSIASAATIGSIALPEMEKRGCNIPLSMGSIVAAGTLAPVIPPSTVMIIYGILARQSIAKLFIAGIVPGVIMAILYSAYIAARVGLQPQLGGRAQVLPWRQSIKGIMHLIPAAVLIVIVLGSIYGGVTTPSEAAAMGAVGSVLVSIPLGGLNWRAVRNAALQTVRITSMSMFLVLGATFATIALAHRGVTSHLAAAVVEAIQSPLAVIAIIFVLYLILGSIMDGFSALIMTLPVVYPIAMAAGYDPIWFGVFFTLSIELGMLTPPVGICLFVVHSLRPQTPISEVYKGCLPFAVSLFILFALMVAFPQLALFLPGRMG